MNTNFLSAIQTGRLNGAKPNTFVKGMTSFGTKSAAVVYRLTHDATGQSYYGVTTNLIKRLRGHMKKSSCHKMFRALQRHGAGAFSVEVVFRGSVSECYAEEVRLIAEHGTIQTGYNITRGGKSGGKPIHRSSRLVGRRFGRLLVLQDSMTRDEHSGSVKWVCRCDCGKVTTMRLTKTTTSCGCIPHDYLREHTPALTHGASGSSTWKAWAVARRDAKHLRVPFDPSWNSFEQFLSDMGERPKGAALCRKYKTAGYSWHNCLWGSRREVSSGSSRARRLAFRGEVKSMAEWSRDPRCLALGLTYTVIRARKNILKWDDRKTLSTSNQPKHAKP